MSNLIQFLYSIIRGTYFFFSKNDVYVPLNENFNATSDLQIDFNKIFLKNLRKIEL